MTFDPLASLLHRDAMLLILNKPAGLPVHAGPPSSRGRGSNAPTEQSRPQNPGENLGHYLDALRFGLPRLPQLAHRLDRDTSGCLALGRHTEALRRLGKLFEQGRVEKTYWAIVAGAPPQIEGRIDQPLLRSLRPGGYGFRMLPDPAGQEAITDYKILGQHNGQSWLELRPRTGRTHQLRVHCAHLGCPIIGDDKYGTKQGSPDQPLHLHARSLSIPLYPRKPPVTATAPPPPHFTAWLALLEPPPPPIIL